VFSTCAVRENADNKLDGNLGNLKPVNDRTPGMPPLDRFVVVCRFLKGRSWAVQRLMTGGLAGRHSYIRAGL